MAHRR